VRRKKSKRNEVKERRRKKVKIMIIRVEMNEEWG
jgi:hypothetical protein